MLGQADSLVPTAVLSHATACYGGFHAIASRADFPNPVEQYYWRLSVIYIGVLGATVSIASLLAKYHSIFTPRIVKLSEN